METVKKHKEEVNKLLELENELSDLILKTENVHLMTVFNDWQDQRNVCNEIYIGWVSGVVKESKDTN